MTSRHDTHRPKFLDKVWVYQRVLDGVQPNGYVQWINWRSEDKDVHVKFLDCSDVEVFPLSDFKDNYNGSDQWLLPKSGWECHLQNIKSGAWKP